MKIALQDGRRFILRFDRGEEVFENLNNFLKTQGIRAAAFSGIGACSEVCVGLFSAEEKKYHKQSIQEELEIVSLIGNAGVLNGEPVIHAHGSFGKRDLIVFGGHVFKLVISLTCEIFLIKLEGDLKRELDQELNLNLLV